MDTTEFLEYAHNKFDVDLPEHPAWAQVAELNWDTRAPHTFTKEFNEHYDTLIKQTPELETLARPLFFAMVRHGASQPSTAHWWPDIMATALPLWTVSGTRDMSTEEATVLTSLLRPRLQHGVHSVNKTAAMLLASPALWATLGKETLQAAKVEPGKEHELESGPAAAMLVHRYTPEKTAFDARDSSNAYAGMCGMFQDKRPNLAEMSPVLAPHHNTLAWRIALGMCEMPNTGDWTKLQSSLGALPLLPSDPNAWTILARLHELAPEDASCSELVRTMESANPGMAAAYPNIWPAVSVMYDAKERDGAAVALWGNAPGHGEALELPSMGLD